MNVRICVKFNKTNNMKELYINFELRLNIDSWGEYKKGDVDYFIMPVLSELNGLVRFPIDSHWDIISTTEVCNTSVAEHLPSK